MDRHTIPRARVLGIPLELDYSWFLVFALLTWAPAVGITLQQLVDQHILTSGGAPSWSGATKRSSAALAEMDRDGVSQLPVMVDHRVAGKLRREDIITFLRAAQRLRAGAAMTPSSPRRPG